MIRLLQIEVLKLRNNRSSRLLIIAYFILLTFISLIAAIRIDLGAFKFNLADQGIFNFPYIWHFNTYIAAFFKLFLAIVIVSMISSEYSNRTLKQNLIDGLSKKEFIFSKFLTVIVFALISTVFVFIISLILGGMYSSYNELSIIFSDLEYLLAYFLKLVGFFSFCLFLALLTKRSAFALGLLVLWSIAELIFIGIIKFQLFFDQPKTAHFITQFLPLEAMSNLIKEPFSRLSIVRRGASQLGEEITKNYAVQFTDVFISLIWIGIFVGLSYYLLKRRDL